MQGIIGTILLFAGDYVPTLHLECNGQAVLVSEYSQLYSVIGNTYGGDGISFNLPSIPSPIYGKYIICVDGYFPTR